MKRDYNTSHWLFKNYIFDILLLNNPKYKKRKSILDIIIKKQFSEYYVYQINVCPPLQLFIIIITWSGIPSMGSVAWPASLLFLGVVPIERRNFQTRLQEYVNCNGRHLVDVVLSIFPYCFLNDYSCTL